MEILLVIFMTLIDTGYFEYLGIWIHTTIRGIEKCFRLAVQWVIKKLR